MESTQELKICVATTASARLLARVARRETEGIPQSSIRQGCAKILSFGEIGGSVSIAMLALLRATNYEPLWTLTTRFHAYLITIEAVRQAMRAQIRFVLSYLIPARFSLNPVFRTRHVYEIYQQPHIGLYTSAVSSGCCRTLDSAVMFSLCLQTYGRLVSVPARCHTTETQWNVARVANIPSGKVHQSHVHLIELSTRTFRSGRKAPFEISNGRRLLQLYGKHCGVGDQLYSSNMPKFAWACIAIAVLLTFFSMHYLSTQYSLASKDLIAENEYLQHALEVAKSKVKQGLEKSKSHFIPAQAATKIDPLEAGFAYVFYAVSDMNACSVLVNIHRLQQVLDSKLPVHVLVLPEVADEYVKAIEGTPASVHVQHPPEKFQNVSSDGQVTMLKLLTFDMASISSDVKRVLVLDGDQMILRNLDDLFQQLPEVNISAPRAYWMPNQFLASSFMMIDPSKELMKIAESVLDGSATDRFDLDLVSGSLERTALLSGRYVTLNSHFGDWNLPAWYEPSQDINMTTVELVNELSRGQSRVISHRRQDDITAESASISSSADSPAQTESIIRETLATTLPPVPATPVLRFPEKHPITAELYLLQEAASVLHFTQKPWTYSATIVFNTWPDAHPLLVEQIKTWRETAAKVCPGGLPDAPGL